MQLWLIQFITHTNKTLLFIFFKRQFNAVSHVGCLCGFAAKRGKHSKLIHATGRLNSEAGETDLQSRKTRWVSLAPPFPAMNSIKGTFKCTLSTLHITHAKIAIHLGLRGEGAPLHGEHLSSPLPLPLPLPLPRSAESEAKPERFQSDSEWAARAQRRGHTVTVQNTQGQK